MESEGMESGGMEARSLEWESKVRRHTLVDSFVRNVGLGKRV